jgi:hypothetical protein
MTNHLSSLPEQGSRRVLDPENAIDYLAARLLVRAQKTIDHDEFTVPTGLRTGRPVLLNSNGS